MNCIACSGNLRLLGTKDGFKVHRCTGCGIGITENLKNYTGNYHRDEVYIEESKLFKNIFLKRVNIISSLIKPGKVLEVGCSTGLMLSLFKDRGWEVLGIEVSKKAAEVSQLIKNNWSWDNRASEILAKLTEKI